MMNETDNAYMTAVNMIGGETAASLSKLPSVKQYDIREIRLRKNKPIALTDGSETLFLREDGSIVYTPERAVICTGKQIGDIFNRLCGYSVYSRQSEIVNGYITVKGGHRIGICGTADVRDGEINSVTDITSMNVRIARFIKGVSAELIDKIKYSFGGLLIAGSLSTGKTTMLRDIAYRVSMGIGCKRMRTCIIDERGEISGTEDSGTYTGMCDILLNYPKGKGIISAIRSLSPQLIVVDEVGTREDAAAIALGANAGVNIIATIHAGDITELIRRPQARLLLDTGAFDRIIMMNSVDKPCSYTMYNTDDVYFMTSVSEDIVN